MNATSVRYLILCGLAAACSSEDAGGGAARGDAGAGGAGGLATGPFPPVTALDALGPFTSVTVESSGPGGAYTLYHPAELAPGGARNPIVGWMSGGGTGPGLYTLLPHLASHGFVVVASNTVPGVGTEVALGQEILAGIDWALAENERPGSPFEGKLEATKIASMGYSMGSLATFTIAADPRLTTTVHISGGNMIPERVGNLHAPAAFLCGLPGDASCTLTSADCDIAGANCATDFAGATTPVFYGTFPAGHLGVLQAPHSDRIRAAVTGWLRWQLMADSTLEALFVGDACTLCSDPGWQVQQKNL